MQKMFEGVPLASMIQVRRYLTDRSILVIVDLFQFVHLGQLVNNGAIL